MRVSLEARNVSFGYPESPPILSEWSAEFVAGSMTALTGPSGRGKSTLLYLLGLMLRPSTGEVLIDGAVASTASDRARAELRARRFGFVFQDAALDPTRTVLDNVLEVSLYRGDDRTSSVANALSLLERFGVDVPAGRRPGQVSGGQAQRIALCRALLADPDVILADEPTGNLDPGSAILVIDALKERARAGATVVIVTHAVDVAAACDAEIRL